MLQCVKQIETAYLKMSDQFKEGTVEPWQPSLFEGYVALEANTRYFTHTNHANPGDIVEFAPHVDTAVFDVLFHRSNFEQTKCKG
jgi:hypothetical protein